MIQTVLSMLHLSTKKSATQQRSQIQNLKDEVREAYETSQNTFKDMEGLSDSDREYLQLFSLISSLSFDVYAKKALIERIIDELPEPVHKKK